MIYSSETNSSHRTTQYAENTHKYRSTFVITGNNKYICRSLIFWEIDFWVEKHVNIKSIFIPQLNTIKFKQEKYITWLCYFLTGIQKYFILIVLSWISSNLHEVKSTRGEYQTLEHLDIYFFKLKTQYKWKQNKCFCKFQTHFLNILCSKFILHFSQQVCNFKWWLSETYSSSS